MTDIIANILLREIGSTPKVQPVTPSTGLGAMTSRKGITAPQEEQQADPTQNIQRPIIDIYRKIVQQEIGDGSGLTGDKIPYDPLVDTPETLAARGYNPDEVLRNSVFSSTISGTKGRTPKDKVLTDIEDLIQSYEDKRLAKKRSVSKERATASSSILDVLEAELMRGMTSKQTDTQPTVSADSSRDRLELQGEMRDLPVLDDEDAPEVDTRSNELLDKPLSTVREEAISNQGLMTKKTKGILDFIGEGEGGYNSANRGTKKVNNKNITIGSDLDASRNGKPISELTIAEIQELQKIKDPDNVNRLFTVGKYQTTPDTLSMAVKALDLEGDVVFSPEIQDQIGMYLVGTKRKKLGQYLSGDENVSTDRAMLDLAMEFASIPVPYAIKKGTYGSWPKVDVAKGETFYKDGETNKALHTVEETRDMLTRSFGMIPDTLASIRPKARPDTRIASN